MERTQNMCQSTRTSWPCYRRTALGTTSWTNHLHLVREYTTSFPLTKLRAWDLSCAKISFAQVYAKQVRDICLKCSYRVKKTKSVHPSDEATHNINVYIYIYMFSQSNVWNIGPESIQNRSFFCSRNVGSAKSKLILGNYNISYILIPEKTSSSLLPNYARCRARVGE